MKISSKSWSHINEQGQQIPCSVKLSLRGERGPRYSGERPAWKGRERKRKEGLQKGRKKASKWARRKEERRKQRGGEEGREGERERVQS